MTGFLSDGFVRRVLKNRKVNTEAYSVFVRLNNNVKEKKVVVSESMEKLLAMTLKYDRQQH